MNDYHNIKNPQACPSARLQAAGQLTDRSSPKHSDPNACLMTSQQKNLKTSPRGAEMAGKPMTLKYATNTASQPQTRMANAQNTGQLR